MHEPGRSALLLTLLAFLLSGMPFRSPCVAVGGTDSPEYWRDGWQEIAAEGDGFVVWESNRSGAWRIWRRELDGSGLRRLSREENGRDHYCSHISPDGQWIAYLSFPHSLHPYKVRWAKQGEAPVQLRLMSSDGRSDRILVSAASKANARGNRAAVWFTNRTLAYVDEKDLTREIDIVTGESRQLVEGATGYLVDATRSYAFDGQCYHPYDRGTRTIRKEGKEYGGCEPYASHDGLWGIRSSGAGGPLSRIRLSTGAMSSIIGKDDRRMPSGRGYLYFPMFSRCQRMFAFGASPNQHDHSKSDYDVFVSRADPKTLELIGRPVRYTFHPKTDRYPDVFLGDLDLGDHEGEAPLTVRFQGDALTGRTSSWEWDYGDGSPAGSSPGVHTYRRPGKYPVAARQAKKVLRGRVAVAPAAPPRPVATFLRGDSEVVVVFDEAVDLRRAEARLASGIGISERRAEANALTVVFSLAEPLRRADRLQLSGVSDRAQRPNVMSTQSIPIRPRAWPARTDGLVFVFETADQQNLAGPTAGSSVRTYRAKPRAMARLDRHHAMVVAGGAFVVDPEVNPALLAACRRSNELTLEASLTSDRLDQGGPARIVSFSSDASNRNFTLGQQDERLVMRLRTPKTGRNGTNPQTYLCALRAGVTHHVVVTYRPGVMQCYLDGKEILRSDRVGGDFSNWSPHHLVFGDEHSGGRDWAGTLEGVAIYNRVLPPEEVKLNAQTYAAIRRGRPAVPRIRLVARLTRKSGVPTPAEIKPYRQGLAVLEYQVEAVLAGALEEKSILAAQWAIMDGEVLDVRDTPEGARFSLVLEPYEDNRQLAALFCRDDFTSEADLFRKRYYVVTAERLP